jgi:hypothetical protein
LPTLSNGYSGESAVIRYPHRRVLVRTATAACGPVGERIIVDQSALMIRAILRLAPL